VHQGYPAGCGAIGETKAWTMLGSALGRGLAKPLAGDVEATTLFNASPSPGLDSRCHPEASGRTA
jgi:hypothetical protein